MLNDVSVVGAAGKMGRGIALLLLQAAALKKLEHPEESFSLYFVDSNQKALDELKLFLKIHLRKFAEKKINLLRRLVESNPNLVSNGEIIDAFIEGGMDSLWLSTEIHKAEVIFEAIVEDEAAKVELFKQLDCDLIFTNTSSIPIHVLQEKSRAKCPIVGFHFYNPANIQKVVELAFAENTTQEVREKSFEWAKHLGKTPVVSKDIAGFIGNGFLFREIIYACKLVEEMGSTPEAICIVNKISGDFLLRPMGIFDLIHYIGVDTCLRISDVLSRYLELPTPALLKHLKNPSCKVELGDFPWKRFKQEKDFDTYFKELSSSKTKGAELARNYLNESRKIAKQLVSDGVARSLDDVNTVLKEGFHHLYGVEDESP